MKAKTFHRTKAYQWLRAANHMLQVCSGRGFEQFTIAIIDDLSDLDWSCLPSLTLVADQGGDGYSAVKFLIHNNYNVLPIWDQSHRVWNDVQLGIQDSELYFFCLATIVILNADSGPFASQRWWESMKEGAEEYVQVANTEDPVFTNLVMQVKEDKFGSDHGAQMECLEDELFAGSSKDIDKKS